MVTEQRVAIDVVEVAVFFGRTSGLDGGHVRHVETEQSVQPAFDGISWTISVIQTQLVSEVQRYRTLELKFASSL